MSRTAEAPAAASPDYRRAGPILPDHIPTALTAHEAWELHRLAAGRTVLEFGSLLGYSTIVLAQSAKIVYAVDPHQGYPLDNPRPTLDGFIANLDRHMIRDKVLPILGRGDQLTPLLRVACADMAFIDITRAADELMLAVWRLKIPVIAVHDYGIPKWTGATEAVHAHAQRTRSDFRLVDTLAIFEHSQHE